MFGKSCLLLAPKALIARNVSNSNSTILPMMFNRNPRNLERLRLAKKPVGYYFDKRQNKRVEYWHKLCLDESNKFLTAAIEHSSGVRVVVVSTQEWAFQKYLYSPKDMCAHITLAKVFAERCLESGITHCYCDIEPQQGTKVEMFLNTVQEEGLTLQEPTTYNVHAIWQRPPERKPWLITED